MSTMCVHFTRQFLKVCQKGQLNSQFKMLRIYSNYAKFSTSHTIMTKEPKKEKTTGKELDISRDNPYAGLTPGQKVVEAGKDMTYLLVILGGVAVTGLMAYTIGRELFSKESSSGVYGQASKKCSNNTQVIDTFGEPLKFHGERTRRGRARHVNYIEFEKGGVKHMRLQFYIEGAYKKGTVHVEVRKNDRNKYEYQYLIVEVDGYPPRQIVIEDNR